MIVCPAHDRSAAATLCRHLVCGCELDRIEGPARDGWAGEWACPACDTRAPGTPDDEDGLVAACFHFAQNWREYATPESAAFDLEAELTVAEKSKKPTR